MHDVGGSMWVSGSVVSRVFGDAVFWLCGIGWRYWSFFWGGEVRMMGLGVA